MNCPVAPGLGLPALEITNTVVAASLGVTLNLVKLCAELPHVPFSYNPGKFPMLCLHSQNSRLYPRVTFMIADTGGVSCMGSPVIDAAIVALHELAALLRANGVHAACVRDVRIAQLVAHTKLGYYVDMHAVSRRFGALMTLKPTRFPGAVLNKGTMPGAHSVTFTVYANGSAVIAGARNTTEMCAALIFLDGELRSAGAAASAASVVPADYARVHHADVDAVVVADTLQRLVGASASSSSSAAAFALAASFAPSGGGGGADGFGDVPVQQLREQSLRASADGYEAMQRARKRQRAARAAREAKRARLEREIVDAYASGSGLRGAARIDAMNAELDLLDMDGAISDDDGDGTPRIVEVCE
jgi:TATA-box binding protein (TBP) (component of TFIID and TFIIIB)